MSNFRGAWQGSGDVPKHASKVDIRFGNGLLKKESLEWQNYFVVTSPSAHKSAKSEFANQPESIAYAKWLDWTHLQEITDSVPNNVGLIVGVGGGIALDASKYVALKKQIPLILVPTIVSSGAIIHGMFAKWSGNKIVGGTKDMPWVDADHVLVDYGVVHKAPYYLNTSGLGDVLCGYASLSEWRYKSKNGIGPAYDPDETKLVTQHHNKIVTQFPETFDSKGMLTDESIKFIMTAVQDRDSNRFRHSSAPGSDHTFWMAAEEVNKKGWIHGGFVALSAVIVAWHCDQNPETLIGWLDKCKVRFRPSEIAVSRIELQCALEFIPSYMTDMADGTNMDSILRNDPIVSSKFELLWEFLQTI